MTIVGLMPGEQGVLGLRHPLGFQLLPVPRLVHYGKNKGHEHLALPRRHRHGGPADAPVPELLPVPSFGGGEDPSRPAVRVARGKQDQGSSGSWQFTATRA